MSMVAWLAVDCLFPSCNSRSISMHGHMRQTRQKISRAASGRRRIRQYLYCHNPRIECAPTVLNIAAGCQKEIFAPVRTINTDTDSRICGVVNESSAYHKIALPLFLIVLTAGSV